MEATQAEASGETKPKIEANTIQLVVKDQHGNEVHFKVKPRTKFEKIKKAYADKKHIEASTIRFMFDGTRLNDAANPEELAMNDGDVIDCMLEQLGGLA